MPQIPPVPFWDSESKKKFDFAESIYLAMFHFMPTNTVESLENHYRDNKKAVATMRRMSPKHYDKLIADFKARKKEILEKNQDNKNPNETAVR